MLTLILMSAALVRTGKGGHERNAQRGNNRVFREGVSVGRDTVLPRHSVARTCPPSPLPSADFQLRPELWESHPLRFKPLGLQHC